MATLAKTGTVAEPRAGILTLARRVAGNYLLHRVIRAIFTIWFVATITFFMVRLMPGSPVDVYVNTLVTQQGVPYPQAVQLAASLFNINLSDPLWQQYFSYLGSMIHGDLGTSIIQQGVPVIHIILAFLPWTLFSVGVGLILSFIIGMALGILAAYRRESLFDHLATNISSLLHAIPNYIIAILLLVYLGVQWQLVDITAMRGTLSPGVQPNLSPAFVKDVLFHGALPIATYVITTVGGWVLAMRASTESTLSEDYVTVARTRGLRERRIAFSYVGRNASLPLFTQLTLSLAFAVGGSILIETIFVYQGLGLTLQNAINQRDYPLMQGILVIITAVVVFANLIADFAYGWLDPRVRVQGKD